MKRLLGIGILDARARMRSAGNDAKADEGSCECCEYPPHKQDVTPETTKSRGPAAVRHFAVARRYVAVEMKKNTIVMPIVHRKATHTSVFAGALCHRWRIASTAVVKGFTSANA